MFVVTFFCWEVLFLYFHNYFIKNYVLIAVFASIIYIILASKYIRIRQQMLLHKFETLNQYIGHRISLGRPKKKGLKCLIQFNQLNQIVVNVAKMTQEYARFCTPLLSIIIPFYISLQCYLLYIVLFVANTPTTEKQLFSLVVAEVNLYMFVIIHQCAGVVTNNGRLIKQNRKFCFRIKNCPGFKKIRPRTLIKVGFTKTFKILINSSLMQMFLLSQPDGVIPNLSPTSFVCFQSDGQSENYQKHLQLGSY